MPIFGILMLNKKSSHTWIYISKNVYTVLTFLQICMVKKNDKFFNETLIR